MLRTVLLFIIAASAAFQADARFLAEDPAQGTPDNPPSLHRYLYAYQNPTTYVDPTGRTAEELEILLSVAIERYRNSGNRSALGTAGELHLERILKANGEIIIKGPATNPGPHNADLVSYNPENGQLTFFDNKIQQGKASVGERAVTNLSRESRRQRSIDEALKKVETADITDAQKFTIRVALSNAQANSSSAVWAVANATPDELSEVSNKVRRVSSSLAEKGIKIFDLREGRVEFLSRIQSATSGLTGKRLAKAIPIAGSIASSVDAATTIDAAIAEDLAFKRALAELGIDHSEFYGHSVARAVAVLAAEEAGGTSGALGGAAVAAPLSPACGPAAPLCIAAGAIVGGLAGDSAGGVGGEAAFDAAAQELVPREIERIKAQIRNERRSTDFRVIVEDPDLPGGL